MEIRINRDKLLKSVSKVQSIIEKKSNMPVLATILFTADGSTVRISATDLELGFQETINAQVLEEGSITLSGRKIFEILKETKSEEFHIKEEENNWIFLSDGVARFNLASISPEEFPAFVEPEDVSMIAIKGETLVNMINKTIYAVTVEEAGFKLSGVMTEKVTIDEKDVLRMVATDGHRLSLIDEPFANLESLELSDGVMIPKKGMSELNKMASDGDTVEIGFKEKNCVAKKENAFLVMRLLETNFPDYKEVMSKNESDPVDISKAVLLEGMRKMLILSNERYRAVKITLENNVMDLVSTNPDLGEAQEKIEIKYNGERVEAGFNPKYFIDTLQSMQSETIHLDFTDGSKPFVLTGEADEGFIGLIMPMRV
ncbi:MAG: DNA polymerase III subunit beta [Deltaproteobacteria bacterium]|nr:DNA polymerase III subunit beta [Deltaproteobacteria bacterium]